MKHKLKQLAVFDTPDSDGSGKITIHPFSLGGATYHSWQKQERFKGRSSDFLSGLGGISDMGWGFSRMGVWSQAEVYMNYRASRSKTSTSIHLIRIGLAMATGMAGGMVIL